VETIDRLVEADLQNPYCVGIHGLFVEQADERLEAAGARAIVSCNGTSHPTNAIDVLPVLAEQVSLALGRGSADAAE
ncbi:MAG: ribose-phosphate diphosphokinase, partial [Persicimonas sp.]